MENRKVRYTCKCPYCWQTQEELEIRKEEYTYHMCEKCKNTFWIRPRQKQYPYQYIDDPDLFYRLDKNDLLGMMDIALSINDIEWCKEIQQKIDSLNEDGWWVGCIEDEEWEDMVNDAREEDERI